MHTDITKLLVAPDVRYCYEWVGCYEYTMHQYIVSILNVLVMAIL